MRGRELKLCNSNGHPPPSPDTQDTCWMRIFFNNIDHEWAVKLIEPNVIRLVRQMLKAGSMEDYQFSATEEGSGQGSVCLPIVVNIYTHYVLVWWFKEKIQSKGKGFCGLVYADDFAVCFQNK